MSSYESTARLEAERREMLRRQLKQRLDNSVSDLRSQLESDRHSEVRMEHAASIVMTVFEDDGVSGGPFEESTVSAQALMDESGKAAARDELDLSSLLRQHSEQPTKLEAELDSWIRRADERPIVTEKDETDRKRLLTELERIKNDPTIDIEDRVRLVKMRVKAYLDGAVRLTDEDKKKQETTFLEYCALCQMLGMVPTERVPYKVEREVARLKKVAQTRAEEEYISDVVGEIMEDLGCKPKELVILDGVEGVIYSVEGQPLCDVFVAQDGSGIMFETVGTSRDGSLEGRRRLESSANKVCSLYEVIEQRAAEKGVILQRIYMDPAKADSMVLSTEVRRSQSKARKKRVTKKKAQGAEE